MDDLSFVLARIESYADYTNDDARRLTDEQIRAFVGEALSRLHERLHLETLTGETLARVLLRCQFADQLVVRALDADDFGSARIPALHSADRELVGLAERADAIDPAAIDAYLAQIDAALDARARIITAGAAIATARHPPG